MGKSFFSGNNELDEDSLVVLEANGWRRIRPFGVAFNGEAMSSSRLLLADDDDATLASNVTTSPRM